MQLSPRYTLLGHKTRCFDVRLSETGQYAVSAAEDGTARVWSMAKKKTIGIVSTGEDAEVLRVALLDTQRAMQLVTCSADGVASIWNRPDPKKPYELAQQLRHNDGQLYACERLGSSSSLLTAADDTVYVWDLEHEDKRQWSFDKQGTYRFGGERSAEDEVVVFDAKPAPGQTDVLGLALSDGTFRVLDTRDSEPRSTIHASEAHLTALSWQDAHTVLLCGGDGSFSSWDVRSSRRIFATQAHERAVFGAARLDSNHWLTYSSDCLLKVWSVDAAAGAMEPATALSLQGFPVYSCAVDPERRLIVCAGGTSAMSVVGTPIHVVKYKHDGHGSEAT